MTFSSLNILLHYFKISTLYLKILTYFPQKYFIEKCSLNSFHYFDLIPNFYSFLNILTSHLMIFFSTISPLIDFVTSLTIFSEIFPISFTVVISSPTYTLRTHVFPSCNKIWVIILWRLLMTKARFVSLIKKITQEKMC